MEIKQIVKKVLKETVDAFQANPDIFLTEEDARCYIVSQLQKYKKLSTLLKTADESYSIPVHSEVRWYGHAGKLKWRSDIVIIDVSTLQTGRYIKPPSKGYGFNKFNVVIELKLRRRIGHSDRLFKQKISEDIEKLEALKVEAKSGQVRADYYSLNFDKKKDIHSEVNDLKISGITFIYAFKFR